MSILKGSKETTIAGAFSGLAIIFSQIAMIFDKDPLTNPDYVIVAGAIGMMVAFWRSRDNNKTSEDIGLK